jgi:hypothetical protein
MGFGARYDLRDGGGCCSRWHGGFCNSNHHIEKKVLTKKLWILY